MKKRLMTLLLAGVVALSMTGCKKDKPAEIPGDKTPTGYDNETTALRFATQELDGVFNPFFSTSAPDSSVVSMTQLGMINNDKNGKPVYGENEPTVVLDYATVETGSEREDNLRTTYYFVLKNNVKFSNGSPLTMKDVLFNLYVYLDPSYTGSSTIYSTDIVGLKEYRTQQETEGEQDSFMKQFTIEAETRIEDLVASFTEIKDENDGNLLTEESLKDLLEQKTEESASGNRQHLVEDYEKALELIKDELKTDFTNNKDSFEDISFKNEAGQVRKPFTTDVETFLYTEGYISYDKKNDELSCSFGDLDDVKTWSEEKAIDMVYQDLIPYKLDEVVLYWSKTSTTLYQDLTNMAMEEYFKNNESGRKFRNISGIKFANRTEPVTVNGKKYDIPEYDGTGVKSEYNEVLSITINGVDPKAIWNFSFGVAPMYYYSDQEHINKFDYESNFGVEYGSIDFMNKVIKDPEKIGVPMGAGAYQACTSSGSTSNVTSGEFNKDNVISYVRNEHFIMGAPKIKNVRFQVIPQNNMINTLESNGVDYVEPNAKPELIQQLEKMPGIAHRSVQTSGYGYIGINAGKVPNIKVRQIIMHSIDTKECVSYYGTTAKEIYRPMSLSSWAYPKGATAYYPYLDGPIPTDLDSVSPDYADYVRSLKASDIVNGKLTKTAQENFIKQELTNAGYSLNASTGVYFKGNDKLQYTFTIAGNETDHPAYNAMVKAAELLNNWGFEITVKTDSQALRKLASGNLTVWAAAWSSTIDPDMYQVYHKDSKAGSTTNWGYREILQNNGGKYDTEVGIVETLSDYIDRGRHTNNEEERSEIYKQALNEVMKLAVELPTYQRDDLFAYNVDRIDESTLTPESDLTSFNGLTTKNWLISFNEYK